ncbi:Serine protease, partial [Globisporangium splendens]
MRLCAAIYCSLSSLALFSFTSTALQIRTWSSCTLEAAPDGFPSLSAECTTAVVPLCGGNLCVDPDNQTISLYLKRIAATNTVQTTRHLWVIPDRSDYVLPSQVDTQLQMMYRQLGGDVSVYTLDQRGTGRSSQITCDTSSTLDANAIVRCSQALNVLLGDNLAAFSITSAAYDLVTIISQTQATAQVYVYGLGYGTLVVERLLHYGIANVRGYILDGSATTSGARRSAFAYISKADEEFGTVGDAFLTLCERDSTCAARFQDDSVSKVLSRILSKLDDTSVTDDTNCASVFQAASTASTLVTTTTTDPASYRLRRYLAMYMQNATERAFIPVLIYRLNRCNETDKVVLTAAMTKLQRREETLRANQEVVYDLNAFSELWESPSAMEKRLSARFTEALISSGRIYDQLLRYCLYTGDSSTSCTELNTSTAGIANMTRLAYTRDEYWNAAATIPSTASVLLLNGDLDGQTPIKYAQELLNALNGRAKELLTFEAAPHNVLLNSYLDDDTSCGLAILESYITNSGNLDNYDTSCMDKLPSVNFALTRRASIAVLNTTDAYDGELLLPSSNSSSSGSSGSIDSANSSTGSPPIDSSSQTEISSLRASLSHYRTAFIVVSCMLVVTFLILAVILYRLWREKQYRDEQAELQQLRDNDVDLIERMQKQQLGSTINFKSLSSDESWQAGATDLPISTESAMDWTFQPDPNEFRLLPPQSDSDWNFRSNPRGDRALYDEWNYSSSNHLRL